MHTLLSISDFKMHSRNQIRNFEFFEDDLKKNDRCFRNSLLKTKSDTKAVLENRIKSSSSQFSRNLIKYYKSKNYPFLDEIFLNRTLQLNSELDKYSINPLLKTETDIQLKSNTHLLEINHIKPP